MLSKSTLQKIKRAYVANKGKGSVIFDKESVERFHIARLILVDAARSRSVVITLSNFNTARELQVHSFEGSIAYYEINDIVKVLSENEYEK